MNCKPGDLAVIVGTSEYAGKLVEILYAAPRYSFTLPDGYPHDAAPADRWIVEMLGSLVSVPLVYGAASAERLARYASVWDAKLRPLRPGEEAARTLEPITETA